MHTLVRVENANCSYCMNAVRAELLTRPLVRHVQMSAVDGCLDVEHDHDDPAALIAVLTTSLHGWQAADNGEIVAVTTNSTLSTGCAWHAPDNDTCEDS